MKISKLPFYKKPLIAILFIFLMFAFGCVSIFLFKTNKIEPSITTAYYLHVLWLLSMVVWFIQVIISKLKKEEKIDFIKVAPENRILKNKEEANRVKWNIWIITIIVFFLVMLYYSNQFLGVFFGLLTFSQIGIIWIPIITIVSFSSLINRYYTQEEIILIELHPQRIKFFKEKGTFYEFEKTEIGNLKIANNSIEISYIEKAINKQISFTTNYFEDEELNPLVESLNL